MFVIKPKVRRRHLVNFCRNFSFTVLGNVCHDTARHCLSVQHHPNRCRSVKDNLILFDEMKRGLWEEGTCSLRMKGDLRSDVTSMWDLAAYRIKFEKHPHSSDRYCIYPTYDYTHCLVDSLENVTHSLCTLEFETRQAPNGPYYWLLDSLGLYKPITWEFARCNITHNVLSKRKLNRLITEGHVTGWDDPRLLTIEGLRRPRLHSDVNHSILF